MCGIAGFVHKNRKLEERHLKKMADSIQYRGPDDEGYFLHNYDATQIGLAHRRLSILDLSKLGHQPMQFDNLTIVHNGEVYNFKEIRRDLIAHGYTFNSDTDTEVILKAFHKWGMRALQQFNGMFAIALYDSRKKSLYLIRDRMGVKPLYYYYDGCNIVFSSELKPIFYYPFFNKRLKLSAINKFAYYGYIAAPGTIFEDVYKLQPGKYLEFNNGELVVNEYWSVKERFQKRVICDELDEDKLIDQLDDLLTSSVRYRMISDVPLGAFLSGGYDSSLITAIMCKLSNRPIDTFSIGFQEKKFDEAIYSREVSRFLKTNHHECYFTIDDFDKLVKEFIYYFDEPFADSSQLPTMLVSRLAKKDVAVVLSGDGGDELFCGYRHYDGVLQYKNNQALSKFLNLLDRWFDVKYLLSKIGMNRVGLLFRNTNVNILNTGFLCFKYYFDGLVIGSEFAISQERIAMANLTKNIQEANMLMDMTEYIPDDLLTKVDRASMAVSLEARIPLLDYRIVEFSFKVPHRLKYRGCIKKYLLKKLAYRYIPKSLLDRPKKGFSVPRRTWIDKNYQWICDVYFSDNYLRKQGIFNIQKINLLLDGYKRNKNWPFETYLWHLIVFQMWHKKYVD